MHRLREPLFSCVRLLMLPPSERPCMIIVDKPYVSFEMAEFLEKTKIPVLRNSEAEKIAAHRALNLMDGREFARRIDAGARLYATSENCLDWVLANIHEENVTRGVRGMKDKHRLRETLRPLYPDYFFTELSFEGLRTVDPETLPLPLVLKPVVGFFSVGVHVIHTPDDWKAALAAIAAGRERWREEYPPDVVGNGRFILEEYIRGDEYALDAYYNSQGQAVIVNVMKHDFTSTSDVSDRLYYTGAGVIRANLPRFGQFLNDVNGLLGLRNFPFHAEVRVDGGRILPIEFNPLRFAGWCSTDLTLFAYGFRTYDHYFQDRAPDWNSLLAGKEEDLYSLVILDKGPTLPENARLDFEAVCQVFTEVLQTRRVETMDAPLFGFLFTRTPKARRTEEMERIMRSDLSEYILQE